jgi:DNA replication protein DnaC
MNRAVDVKVELTQSHKYLHRPTVRQCYEEAAQQAERESLSYERYLHELVRRECEERQGNRISKMLRESQLPLEKSLAVFDAKRLPAKAARQMRSRWQLPRANPSRDTVRASSGVISATQL